MTTQPEDAVRTTFSLDAVVDIRNIGELADRMKACIAGTAAVDLDAGAFESGDVTLVQVLVSAGKTAAERGGNFRIVNAGPALVALLDRCGIDTAQVGLAHRQQEG